jgi:hypothetical protein
MPYTKDTEIDLTPHDIESRYIISSQHRRKGNPNKCVWIITFDDEVNCFVRTIQQNWRAGTTAWGVIVVNNIVQILGRNSSNEELKIAKFVDGNDNEVWHGYPADYMLKSNDRPDTPILQAWVNNGYITKAKMSKIRLGHSCNL